MPIQLDHDHRGCVQVMRSAVSRYAVPYTYTPTIGLTRVYNKNNDGVFRQSGSLSVLFVAWDGWRIEGKDGESISEMQAPSPRLEGMCTFPFPSGKF